MNFKTVIKKQGGFKSIKHYLQSGTIFTIVGELLLLGRSRTALELTRMSYQLKIKKKLFKKYGKHIQEFSDKYNNELLQQKSKKVWICWFQGMENAPKLVQECYDSVVRNMPDREIIVITSNNMFDYVEFPEYIVEKWKSGIITHTHMTDLLRLELLIRYGGMWLDATVFCSNKSIPSYFFDSDLFMYQCLKPGGNGHSIFVSSWLISAKTNNKILITVRDLCYSYWMNNTKMMDYFLFHYFMTITLEFYEDKWKEIVPRDNAAPHILLLRLFEQYDEEVWKAISEQTPFHKLTYKSSLEECAKEGTFYDRLINHNS